MARKPKHKIIKKLTRTQLETLEAFYYGEVVIVPETRKSSGGEFYHQFRYMWGDCDIRGRILSLRRRKLLATKFGENQIVMTLTSAGIEELKKLES